MKHINFSRLFDNKTFCKIFSIVGAILIWAAVTLTAKTDSERILRNVPIDFSVSGTAVEALGLNTFEHSEETVNIKLSGSRAALNNISKEDFAVTLSLGRVTAVGKHTVRVDVCLKENVGTVSILDYSPKTIQINFDRNATKTLPINISIPNVSAKDGFMIDKGYPSLPEITISGPESIIKNVSSCVASVDDKKTGLQETISFSDVPLKLYDENSNVISNSSITLDKEKIDISVPVLKIKELPVKVHFINAPSTFYEKDFKYTVSTDKITVAGPSESIDALSQIDIRYLDLKTVKPGDTVTLNVELPSGFINVDDVKEIDVVVPDKDFAEKRFSVSQFKIIGAPEGKEVSVVSKQLNNILLVGKENLISSISSTDIVVEVNISNTTLSSGTMTVPASISIPGKTGVFWAFGDYEVVIKN